MIPVTVMDNFFNYPDLIRKYALEQEFQPCPEGKWPGVRSKVMSELNPHLNRQLVIKLGNIFMTQPADMDVDIYFQLVGEEHGKGWIHIDYPASISAIIYLSPDTTPDSGTSIYTVKKFGYNAEETERYKRVSFLSKKFNPEWCEKNNSYFEETIRVNSVYNRLIAFDSRLNHGAHNFYGTTKEDSRLTIVAFFNRIVTSEALGVERSKGTIDL